MFSGHYKEKNHNKRLVFLKTKKRESELTLFRHLLVKKLGEKEKLQGWKNRWRFQRKWSVFGASKKGESKNITSHPTRPTYTEVKTNVSEKQMATTH